MYFIFSLLTRAVELYTFILFAYALMSWIPDLYNSAIGRWVIWLVKPVLKPFQKLNLQFFGMDWTVFVVIILLHMFVRFLWFLYLLFI